MQWMNFQTSVTRTPEFIGAAPTERATWFCLSAWCCEQENGGKIEGCEDWGDRRWMQTCGVTKAEVQAECDLWKWNGTGLKIAFYPADKEAEVKAKREAGRKGGLRRASSSASRTASTEGEGKGNPSLTGRGKGKTTPPPPGLAGWLRGSRWQTLTPEKAWELATCRKAWEKDNK